jgi:hypothetical protein
MELLAAGADLSKIVQRVRSSAGGVNDAAASLDRSS